jgi:tripartite-type tricarboxylate transporter receptor subunit TctC
MSPHMSREKMADRAVRKFLGATLLISLIGAAGPCFAQTYPQRPVRIVVNVTAGGGVDMTARALALHLNSVFKQPFVVDNRTGAGGSIGIELVAKAPHDGHTLLVCSSGIVTNAAFRPENYDPIRDFQPVSNLVSTPYILVVTPSLPVKSVKDLVALAKAQPDTVRYGTSGAGGIVHLASELLAMLSNTNMTSVHYKGVNDGYPAVVNGDVHWMFGASISALPLVKAGRVRAIAVTSAKRAKALPDLPSVAESGVPGYDMVGWFGMFAPVGTPKTIVEKLSAEARRGLHQPDFAARAEAQGTEIVGSSPGELAKLVKAELETWRKVVAKAGLRP